MPQRCKKKSGHNNQRFLTVHPTRGSAVQMFKYNKNTINVFTEVEFSVTGRDVEYKIWGLAWGAALNLVDFVIIQCN